METAIHLVDVYHDDHAHVLVRPSIAPKLAESVLMKLDRETALCVEGVATADPNHRVMPSQRDHALMSQFLWPGYTSLTVEHPLFGADSRSRIDPGINMQLELEIDALLGFLDKNLELTEIPPSREGSLEWIRRGKLAAALTSKPSSRVKKCADRVLRREKAWLKNYADVVTRCRKTHKAVYVVAGLTHILGLHMQHGWPIMWLTKDEPESTPEFVYRAGMNFSHFADMVRRS